MKKIFTISLFLILCSCITSLTYATLPTPVLLAPANNATNVALPVNFSWNASAGATFYRLQIYIGINLVEDITNIGGSAYIDTTLLGNTQYRWRVRAYSPTDSSAFSGYFVFTTAIAPPPAPVLISPPNNGVNVSITPLMDWSDAPNAQTYHLEVSFDPNFTSFVLNIPGLSSSQYQITSTNQLGNSTLYYWRVNATNTGGTSPWSATWSFTTIPAPPPPLLLLPANGAVNVVLTPTLTWQSLSGGSTFHLKIATDNGFSNVVWDTANIAQTQITVPVGILGGPITYYWKVAASNVGGEGSYSTTFSFTTVTGPPPAPILLVPANGATCVNRFPLLDWQDTQGATSYRIQISADQNFTTTVVNVVVAASQYQVVGNLLTNNTLYYWHAAAINGGGQGPFSATWNFTTVPFAPTAPALDLPANNSTGVSLTPRLVWSHGLNATTYRVQVSYTNTFNAGTIVVDQQNIVDTFYQVNSGSLNGNQSYYWRVSSTNCAATSGYSNPIFHFTTLQTISVGSRILLEGFYNGSTMVQDTVRIYLASSTGTHQIIDSTLAFLSPTGTDTSSFTHAPNGSYYLVIKHRNHLETWSALPVAMSTGNTVAYDFTTAQNKAYGNNLKQVGSAWVIYGGDINQDGTIDPDDYTLFKTQYGRDGYIPSDLNGDTFADGNDLLILYSNFFISKITP